LGITAKIGVEIIEKMNAIKGIVRII